jgi:hypothetical protein
LILPLHRLSPWNNFRNIHPHKNVPLFYHFVVSLQHIYKITANIDVSNLAPFIFEIQTMLEFCQDLASPAMNTIAKNIERSRRSEEGLDLSSLSIPPIGGDLPNGDAFLLWNALGREDYFPSLIRLLGLGSDDKTCCLIAKNKGPQRDVQKLYQGH